MTDPNGLPSLRSLRELQDVPEAFCALRIWIKATRRRGELVDAWHHVGSDYQQAILTFLYQEASKGIRQRQARELLTMLPVNAEKDASAGPKSPNAAALASNLDSSDSSEFS